MTSRDLTKELCYYTYADMEDGNDTESFDVPSLIGLLEELIDRVEGLETQIKDLQELAIAQDYMKNLGL
jgi:hypothetical protein